MDSSTTSNGWLNGASSSAVNMTELPQKLFVCKWVDYSNKYGFGAELCDGSVLVRFNDGSKMTLSKDRQ